MEPFLIFIVIIIGLNCIPLLIKNHSGKLEKVTNRVLLIITIIFGIQTVFLVFGWRLIGILTNSIIASFFILSSLSYFILIKITWGKLIKSVILIPFILLSINTILFGQTIYEKKINNTYNIRTYVDGFLACGESLRITKTAYVIFDQAIYQDDLCIKGITRIETLAFDEKHAEFLIYHDGEMDSENPFKYEIINKNVC